MLDKIFAGILFVAIIFSFFSPAQAVTQWNVNLPQASDSKSNWPTEAQAQWSIADTLLSNYRRGMNILYASSSTLTITAGEVVVSSAGVSPRLFVQNTGSSTLSSTNLDTGSSFSASTTYYIYAGTTSATAASASYYISLSNTAPSGITYYVQLGQFTTDSSSNITDIVDSLTRAHWGNPSTVTMTCGTPVQATADGTLVINLKTIGLNTTASFFVDFVSPPVAYSRGIESGASGLAGTITTPIKAGMYYECTNGSFLGGDFWPLN